ncbi:MAG: repeat-containing protein [Mucilaginibacter sp.]|nr:repeat-containing protein [Mucilaginibacter sp.]
MKKSLQSSFLIILFIAVIASVTGCSKNGNTALPLPIPVINPIISSLTSTSVIVGARTGGSVFVIANGICYSATNTTPTTSDTFLSDTVGARWQNKIIGLTPNTTYYVRAYVTNDSGTGYSDVITFKTLATNAVPTGTVTTFAGSLAGTGGFAEGTGAAALFNGPQNISFNAVTGLLYVSDSFNNAIRNITTSGETSTMINTGLGYANGDAASALFYGPRGISFDTQGNAYVADLGNNVIRKITTGGAVSTTAGNALVGYLDGAAAKAEFYNPTATAVDATGNVYVVDRSNNLIRKITPAGVVSTFAGYVAPAGYAQSTVPGYVDGAAGASAFNYPVAITIDASGNLYVADYRNNAIRMVTPTGSITTYAGGLTFPTLLGSPNGVVLDAQGNMFISDNNGRILEITKNKILYVLAGANSSGYTDGVGSQARFSNPQSLTLDGQGNLYVADFSNNVIRKVTVAVQ